VHAIVACLLSPGMIFMKFIISLIFHDDATNFNAGLIFCDIDKEGNKTRRVIF
jgi:hypothetical protein